jgi:hypothetical protein
MTWGVLSSSTFGAASPDADTIGYDEAIENYFYSVLTEDEQNELNSGMGGVPWTKFSDKFVKDLGWLADHERPKRFRLQKTYKELCSLISLENRLAAVDIRLKEIIEELEPGVHQFWPIELTQPKDKPYPLPYFGMVVHSHLNCFRFEECDPGHAEDKSIGDHIRYSIRGKSRADLKGAAMSRAAIGSHHIWRERYLHSPWFLLSDRLAARIHDAGLKMPKHYPMKDV